MLFLSFACCSPPDQPPLICIPCRIKEHTLKRRPSQPSPPSPRPRGVVSDGGITVEVNVQVNDINDHAPVFPNRYHTLISENLKPGSSILQVFASDADEGDNGAVVYEINRRQSDPDQYFTIDSRTGVTTAFVTIHVRDYNDNQPTMTIIFLSEDGSPQISEGAQPGQYVARISVSDPDYGEYSNVNVSLEGGDGKFALTTKDNIIYLICVDQLLDREERDSYDLRVTATDSGTPPLRAESAFVLKVMDVNDNPPLFDQQEYKQSIPEVVYPGSFVLQVTARDKDQGPNGEVRYSILHSQDTHSNWFTIDPATGIITTAASLDYEKDPQPQLTVLAMDRGTPVLSSTAVVHVALQDVNDNEPVFRSNFYNVSLKENTPAGTCFLQVGGQPDRWGTPWDAGWGWPGWGVARQGKRLGVEGSQAGGGVRVARHGKRRGVEGGRWPGRGKGPGFRAVG
uniref:Cadherin domain-containing protein n=1 Tax=Terrapene triunguis TaxID=2587831 RepID=A0A674JQH3_9SAUR